MLVTGGAGFVGHHLVHRLLELNFSVNVLDDLSTGLRNNVPMDASFFQGDIRDAGMVQQAMEGCDTVFHLAARVELQKSIIDPVDCLSVNVAGTAQIVTECLKAPNRRLVFTSSCAVYPLHPKSALSEEMATLGDTPYALSKRSAEQIIEFYHRLKGLNACSLRCFNIYGPGQPEDSPYAAVIPKFISRAIKGKSLTIFGDGNQTRDFIHVEDVIEGHLLAAQKPVSGVFNLGTEQSISINQLAEAIIEIKGEGKVEKFSARSGDATSSKADMSLNYKALGFEPKITLKQGLLSLYDSREKCTKRE